MKLREGEPWIPAPKYGRSLKSLTLNLLVRNIEVAVEFQTKVLDAVVVYSDPDIAVLQAYGSEWMLHADHTYLENSMYDLISKVKERGIGAEIRLHGCDPDNAAQRARQYGYQVFAEAADKPHGLRECYLQDPDGYMWVADVPCPDDDTATDDFEYQTT